MIWENIRIALAALRSNKLRAGLTMLGIIIGVGAVVAMVSIGMGARDQVTRQISSLGSNLLIITPGGTSNTGMRLTAGSGITLKIDDARAIARDVPGVAAVAPVVSRQYQVVYANQNWITSILGTTPDYQETNNHQVGSGSFFTARDLDTRSRVAVVGQTVAENLFAGIDPIGQTIRIGTAPFRVVGVLERKGQSAGGADQDDVIIIPITTAQERLMGITYVHRISVQAAGPDDIEPVQEEITNLLRKRHKLGPNQDNDFTVRNLQSILATAQAATNTITALLGSIAAISLVVGGIGIMNIMLVSVTERTREIGIRKAIGAKNRDILMQFLVEAVVISVSGGLVGIAAGVLLSLILSALAGWPVMVSGLAIVLSFFFSLAVGLFFGIYPARQAALLDPIEALRYE